MADLPDIIALNYEQLKDKRIDQLLLPGSHDSGAHQVLPPAAQLQGPAWQAPLYYLPQTALKPYASNWTLTQAADIHHQLMSGIRFFDLRISVARNQHPPCHCCQYRDHDSMHLPSKHPPAPGGRHAAQPCSPAPMPRHQSPGQLAAGQTPDVEQAERTRAPLLESGPGFYVTHTLPCMRLEEALLQLRTFLTEHPQEVVVVRLSYDWEHRQCLGPAEGDAALAEVQRVLGGFLFDRSTLGGGYQQQPGGPPGSGMQARSHTGELLFPTVEQMVGAGRPVALFAELPCSVSPAACSNVYLNMGLRPYWADSPTAQGTLQGLAQQIEEGRRRGPPCLRFAAFAATPDWVTIAAGVVSSLTGSPTGLRMLAAETNALLPDLLHLDLSGLMGVTSDFPSEGFVRQVLAVNFSNR